MYRLFNLINKIETIIEILLALRFIISWLMPRTNNAFTDAVYSLTEPLLRPFRSILNFGGLYLDISPIILIFIIRFFKSILFNALSLFM